VLIIAIFIRGCQGLNKTLKDLVGEVEAISGELYVGIFSHEQTGVDQFGQLFFKTLEVVN
jgi:hypothetical protein